MKQRLGTQVECGKKLHKFIFYIQRSIPSPSLKLFLFISPKQLVQSVKLPKCIRRVSDSNLCKTPIVLTEDFPGFLEYLQPNAGLLA
jgi:hypothetical protein